MKKQVLYGLLLGAVLLLPGCKREAQTWRELYNLGQNYLLEENYEEAIVAFTDAIALDPKRERVYIGLANAYVELEEYEEASQAIQDGAAACGESEKLLRYADSTSFLQSGESGVQITDYSFDLDRYLAGETTNFHISVMYRCPDHQDYTLLLGANTAEPDSFQKLEEDITVSGHGYCQFQVLVMPVQWTEQDFGIYVNLSDAVQGDSWTLEGADILYIDPEGNVSESPKGNIEEGAQAETFQAEISQTAGNGQADEEQLRNVLAEYTQEPLLNFIYDDFDGNGSYEAIAFCGTQSDFDGSYAGIFYLITEKGVQVIREYDGYWDAGKLYDFGTAKLFAVTKYFTTGGITFYYQIEGDGIYEVEGSGIGDGLYQDEQGRMCMTDSQYDASVDGTGHTWNVYYFYWDDGLKEYGGTLITAEELLQYQGAEEILSQIAADGYEVTTIYQRKNGIININCCDGVSNKNVRTVYRDGYVEVSPVTEGYYYEDGIIKPALNMEIATF